MNIGEILRQQAAERGEAPALIDVHKGQDRILSFRALDSISARLAEQLAQNGLGRGDTILILHPMAAELYAFLIAAFRIGAIAMFLDPSVGRDYIERCLRMLPPKAFYGSAKAQLLRLWIPSLRRVRLHLCSRPFPGALHLSLRSEGPERNTIAAVEDSDAALITFTSGSTGEPKAALRTHGFLQAQHRALQTSLHHVAGTVDLTTLPIFVLANLASGVTSVLPDADMRKPGHIRPQPVLRQMQDLSISTMAASPALVSRLTEWCRKSNLRLEGMKGVFMGGAPVFAEDLLCAREVFPKADITAVYGSTEAEPMAEISLPNIHPDDFVAMQQGRGLIAGIPVPSLALRILRNQWGSSIAPLNQNAFNKLGLGTDEVGEIVVSGEHVLSGYLKGVGDAETKFRVDGVVWHRTGDLGRIDPQGRLWLLGRASAMIHDERGILYPFAVECAARQVPGIRRAATLSLAGKRILAIEADESTTVDAARQALQWAQLDDVRMLPSIPMDKRHNAKVDYVELQKALSR